ncbi:MAG TPA: asparagine synthase (glutamine-hydrolyzing) [Ignavibacteria bacterium]|nr:asparagine synthase (glutamine-hydrolyzing) [Ignavibacteria bacterium]
MCGIAGIISPGFDVNNDELLSLGFSIQHRGPDHQGIWFSPQKNIGLVHRRLAIIDLSERANEPMSDASGKIKLIFNGEIYNYKEIKSQLEKDYEFRTSSDAEVVIYSYLKWGLKKSLEKFRGFFAFAIYDENINKLFIVRDRFGKKPLHYTTINNKFYFCSELHPFLKLKKFKVNDESIYDYFSIGSNIAPQTFFEGISKLESGHILEYDTKNYSYITYKYFDIADYLNKSIEDKDYFNNFERLLDESVQYRFVADVPVSITLSGGIDSSLNAYYCRNLKPLAVTMKWEGVNVFDESRIAAKVAKKFNLDILELSINPNSFREYFDEYIEIQKDVPIGDINTILIFILSKYLRENNYKVCIVGEGGDELGAYPSYFRSFQIAKYHNLYLFRMLLPFLKIADKGKIFADLKYKNDVMPKNALFGFYEYQKKNFWAGKIFNTYEKLLPYMNEINCNTDEMDLYLKKISNIEYKIRLPELILARIDYPSMASSVEIRAPYMDNKLIEYNSSLNWNVKTKNGTAKSILKELARKHLPEEVYSHPKVGFTEIFSDFFSKELPDIFNSEILQKDCPIKNYVSQNFLKNCQQNLRNENLWRLYSLNKWLEKVS